MAEGGNDEQVLLEAIRHDVQVIAEGHGVLLRELQETRADLQRRMETGFTDIQLGIRTLVKQAEFR